MAQRIVTDRALVIDDVTNLVVGFIDTTSPDSKIQTLGAGGGGGATNLSYTPSPTGGVVASDTGNDASLTLSTGTNAGLMAPADFTKLAGLSSGGGTGQTQFFRSFAATGGAGVTQVNLIGFAATQADLAGITAVVSSVTGAHTVTLANVPTAVRLSSAMVAYNAAAAGANTGFALRYAEPYGATSIENVVPPQLFQYNESGVSQALTSVSYSFIAGSQLEVLRSGMAAGLAMKFRFQFA